MVLISGCEVVRGDFNDAGSLIAATKGAYGAFVNTDFLAAGSKEADIKQVCLMHTVRLEEVSFESRCG